MQSAPREATVFGKPDAGIPAMVTWPESLCTRHRSSATEKGWEQPAVTADSVAMRVWDRLWLPDMASGLCSAAMSIGWPTLFMTATCSPRPMMVEAGRVSRTAFTSRSVSTPALTRMVSPTNLTVGAAEDGRWFFSDAVMSGWD